MTVLGTAHRRELPYRPCVGIMLLNKDGRVWVGRRRPRWIADDADDIWQMPQGGILPGEKPRDAALRELREETGATSVKVLAELPQWLSYDLPQDLLGIALKGRYCGQRQRWFAMRYTGRSDEFSLIPPDGGKPEFLDWRWAARSEIAGMALPFKRHVYETVIREFDHLA